MLSSPDMTISYKAPLYDTGIASPDGSRPLFSGRVRRRTRTPSRCSPRGTGFCDLTITCSPPMFMSCTREPDCTYRHVNVGLDQIAAAVQVGCYLRRQVPHPSMEHVTACAKRGSGRH